MKNFKNLLIILLAFSIIITGCSNKNDIVTLEVPVDIEEKSAEIVQNEPIEVEEVEIKEVIKKTQEKKDAIDTVVESSNIDTNNDKEKNETVDIENKVESKDVIIKEDVIAIEDIVNVEEETDDITLNIEGNVENELKLTLEELKVMDDIIFEADFFALNSFGTKAYFNFKGVKLWSLLENNAEISDDATIITIVAEDGYKMEFTVEQVKKQDYIDEQNPDMLYPMIIAWEQNKVEYDVEDGAPFKLVVGQTEAGDVNKPQWVSNIDKIVVE